MDGFGVNSNTNAVVAAALDSLDPAAPAFGRMTPDEISRIAQQGTGGSLREDLSPQQAAPILPPPVLPMQQAPQPQYGAAPQQQYAQAPQQQYQQAYQVLPPPPPPEMNRLYQLESEKRQWENERQQMQRMQQEHAAMTQFLVDHPETLEPRAPEPMLNAQGMPEDPAITDLRRQMQQMQQQTAQAQRRAEDSWRLGNLSAEAVQLLREWGNEVDLEGLVKYAMDNKIDNLHEALERASGKIALTTLKNIRQQGGAIHSPYGYQSGPLQPQQQPQYPQQYASQYGYPQQQPQYGYPQVPPQYPQQYAPQQYQQQAQTTPPGLEPPPPNGMVVMRPGMAVQDMRTPGPSRPPLGDELFSFMDRQLEKAGLQ